MKLRFWLIREYRTVHAACAPVFQHFATSSDHAENVCVVTFRSLRAHLVWNTRVGTGVPVEQSSVPVCHQIVGSCQHTCPPVRDCHKHPRSQLRQSCPGKHLCQCAKKLGRADSLVCAKTCEIDLADDYRSVASGTHAVDQMHQDRVRREGGRFGPREQ